MPASRQRRKELLDLLRRDVRIGRHGYPKLGKFGQAPVRLGFRFLEIQLGKSELVGGVSAPETDQPVGESTKEGGSPTIVETGRCRNPVEAKRSEGRLEGDREIPESPTPPAPLPRVELLGEGLERGLHAPRGINLQLRAERHLVSSFATTFGRRKA